MQNLLPIISLLGLLAQKTFNDLYQNDPFGKDIVLLYTFSS